MLAVVQHNLLKNVAVASRRCARCLSFRTDFEEQFHLARALSRFDIDLSQQQQWKRKVKRRSWNMKHFAPDDRPPPPYESEALEQIHKKSFSTNVLLEIRDVRVPGSSHHPSFTRLAKHRLHLVCYTHADMIDPPTRDRVENWTELSWPGCRCIFVDTRDNRGIKDQPYDFVYEELLRHLEEAGGLNAALTVGVTNTGKSSVLMALLRTARARGDRTGSNKVARPKSRREPNRRGRIVKAPPPGIEDKPGKTREITEYVLREKPRTYFLDVPGLTPPPFYFQERPEAWFALAAANLLILPYELLEDPNCQTALCDYVLFCMNRDNNFSYVKRCGLEGPTDDILEVLPAVKRGYRLNLTDKELRLGQCRAFLKLFNTGNFGPVVLDDLSKPYQKFVFKEGHFKNIKQRHHPKQQRRKNHGDRRRENIDGRDERKEEGTEFSDDDFQYR